MSEDKCKIDPVGELIPLIESDGDYVRGHVSEQEYWSAVRELYGMAVDERYARWVPAQHDEWESDFHRSERGPGAFKVTTKKRKP